MRITRVRADAFGPLCGQELELADGMTVITGPNESGKSTWHGAIYAALCGMRRGRGAPVTADREFRDHHQPWAGEDWRVSAVIELDDGRTVELHHDLKNLVDCRATDAVRGGDLTGEILFEGTPDGARWLGLNRRTFLSVACVRQTQILKVIEDAGHLQEDLQRAAATAGADQTAARALELIDEVQRERVGLDRANSTRPLRRAKQRLAEARAEEERVRALHDGWQDELVALADLRARAGAAAGRLRIAEAARALGDLSDAEDALSRVDRLRERNPIPPPEPVDPEVSDEVTRALAAWDHRREPRLPPGEDAAALRARLDALPDPPPPSTAPFGGAGTPPAAHTITGQTAIPPTVPPAFRRSSLPVLVLGTGLLVAGIVLAVFGPPVFGPPVLGAAVAGTGMAVMVGGAAMARSRRSVVTEDAGSGTDVDPGRAEMEARLRQAERAHRVEQRAELERRLGERVAAEQHFATDQALVVAAADALRSAARRCGLSDTQVRQAPDVLATALRTWHAADQTAARRASQARQEWAELQALLAGRSPEQLQAEVAALRTATAELVGSADPAQLASWVREDHPDRQVARLRSDSAHLERELAALRREVEVRTEGVCSVADAVEGVTAALQALARVETLGDDLATARRFLEAAQDRAHRNLAPQLADAVRPRLSQVTSGRYTDVRVDPEALMVRVMAPDGRWREATRLSQGTAEQVYLLLRVAMADMLTEPGTSCPLLLDDVLVQSDPLRSRALLELLLAESERRQVILFSQEDDVTAWARDRLTGIPTHGDRPPGTDPRHHRHIELAPAAVGPPVVTVDRCEEQV